ncbi:MAG: MurR/RpiR family transcriptional regulator [Alkalibacterium sp.]|uniref:MurR/RpiR family transcriptional regulator n=1 Tax=Alkalibacterium sp. TaxID=1872447 RepID=UPI003970D78F
MAHNYLEQLLLPRKKNFNDTETLIADHLLVLGGDVVTKTLNSLSEEIGVSEATIFKFVKKIGFEGFQNFKISVASNFRETAQQKAELTTFSDITKNDSACIIAKKVVQSSQESLDSMIHSLNEQDLLSALDILYSSETVHFFGQGASSIVAFDSYHKFIRTNFQCNYIFDYHMQLSYSTKLNKKDCVFLFSHSGQTQETIEVAKILKENGVNIISLTGNPDSKLVKLSDVSFVVYSEDSVFRSESLTSRILYLTLIDILYVNVMYHDEKDNKQSLEKIRKALNVTKTGG